MIILTFLAVIPAIVLMRYVYKQDKIEKEPTGLLIKLAILGVISTVCAMFTEAIGSVILNVLFYSDDPGYLYNILMYFIVVALSEEGVKYMVLKRATWKNPNFDYVFDGIVYAVFVSLGFALWEAIL